MEILKVLKSQLRLIVLFNHPYTVGDSVGDSVRVPCFSIAFHLFVISINLFLIFESSAIPLLVGHFIPIVSMDLGPMHFNRPSLNCKLKNAYIRKIIHFIASFSFHMIGGNRGHTSYLLFNNYFSMAKSHFARSYFCRNSAVNSSVFVIFWLVLFEIWNII